MDSTIQGHISYYILCIIVYSLWCVYVYLKLKIALVNWIKETRAPDQWHIRTKRRIKKVKLKKQGVEQHFELLAVYCGTNGRVLLSCLTPDSKMIALVGYMLLLIFFPS